MGEVVEVNKSRKQLKNTRFPRIVWKEGYFERKKLLFHLRCKLPGAQGKLVYRIWPIFAKIYASYYENSGR